MKERQYVDERKTFCREDKEFVLMKSGGRCCHCGKKLSIDNDFTIEHIIPLSKGGTNQHTNIVALCNSCNHEKSNNIVSPIAYYRYLHEEYVDDVLEMYAEYQDEFSYFNSKNLLFTDVISNISPHIIYDKGGGIKTCVPVVGDIKKAKYCDLDKIYNTYRSYLRKFKLDTQYLKSFLSEVFRRGCIYFQTNKAGDITLVLPFVVLLDTEGVKDLALVFPICVYDKIQYYNYYSSLMRSLLSTLLEHVGIGFCRLDGYFLKDKNSEKLGLYYRLSDSIDYGCLVDEGSYYSASAICGHLDEKLAKEYHKIVDEYFTTYLKLTELRLV